MKYMGVRSCKCLPQDDDKYLGSSHYTPAKEFVISKEILALYPSRKEAVQAEILYHQTHDVGRNELYYNKAIQKSDGFDTTGFNFERTPEHCERISKALTGRQRTPEERLAMSKARKGIPRGPHTQSFKDAVSKAHKGKSVNPESIAKMVQTRKANDSYGHTEETKAKIAQSLIENPPYASPVIFTTDDKEPVQYQSIAECSRETGISAATMKGRLNRGRKDYIKGWSIRYATK